MAAAVDKTGTKAEGRAEGAPPAPLRITAGPSALQTANELRRMRARRLFLRLGLGVGVPTLLAVIYFAGIATPQYESISTFTIEAADGGHVPAGLELLLGGGPGGISGRDLPLVSNYILSRDMMSHLVTTQGFSEHYRTAKADFLSRLGDSISSEELFEYYLDRVTVEHDAQAGTLSLSVVAFSANDAHQFGQAILSASEDWVNRMSEKARQDRILLAQREVDKVAAQLAVIRGKIQTVQSQREDLNPIQTAGAVVSVREGLEAELARARAELGALLAVMQPNAPQVVAQRARVGALSSQVEHQRNRLVDRGSGLGESIAEFEPLMQEKELTERAYTSALTSLEMARLEADRQHRYVAIISAPSKPDAPTHPRVFRSVLTVFLLSLAFVTVMTLLIAALREHAQV